MGNDISTVHKSCKIVIQSKLGDIATHVNDPNETWSQLCHRTIEKDYLSKLLPLLVQVYPEKRLSAYRLRYDTGLATIIKPTWHHPDGINHDVPEEDAFVDINASLRPSSRSRNNDNRSVVPAFAPHETILSSLGEDGAENTTFVDFHFAKIGFDEGGSVGPFPVVKERTRVLFCNEHEHFPGCIDDYKIEECSDENGNLPRKCVNLFSDGGSDLMDVEETEDVGGVKKSGVENREKDKAQKSTDSNKNAQKKRKKGEAAMSSNVASNKANGDNGGDEACAEKSAEKVASKKVVAAASATNGEKKIKSNIKVIPRHKTLLGASPKKKAPAADTTSAKMAKKAMSDKEAAASKISSTSTKKGTDKEITSSKEDAKAAQKKSPAKKKPASPKRTKVATDIEESPHKKKLKTAQSKSTSKVDENVDDKKASDIDENVDDKNPSDVKPKKQKAKKNESNAKRRTPKYPTGEAEMHIPAEPAKEFPPGWTTRRVPRATGKAKDLFYYSPKLGIKFRIKSQAKHFTELLNESLNGDEEAAFLLYKQKGKKTAVAKGQKTSTKGNKSDDDDEEGGKEQKGKNGKKTAVTNGKKKSLKGDMSDDDEGAKGDKIPTTKTKRKRDESATEQALKELVSGGKDVVVEEGEAPKKKKSKSVKEKVAESPGKSEEAEVNTDDNTKSTTTKKRSSTTKKVIDPNQPKRPPTPFVRFCSDARTKLKKENPDMTYSEVTLKLREVFKSLGEDKLKPYKDEAAEALKKFNVEMKAYKQTLA